MLSACVTTNTPGSLPTRVASVGNPVVQPTQIESQPEQTSTTAHAEIAPGVQGRLNDRRLSEISGLAVSQRVPNRLWAINDSGNRAQLFALDFQAQLEATYDIEGANRDWEALALSTIDEVPYLLVADVGDNLQRYSESYIHFIKEPDNDSDTSTPLTHAFTVTFRFPDGPHNVEAMAVTDQQLLLITKERLSQDGAIVPSRIYRLPEPVSNIDPAGTAVAEFIGFLAQPNRGLRVGLATKLLNIDPLQPTDMVINEAGTQAYVLNYLQVLNYSRLRNETWGEAFAKVPTIFYLHGLRQAEAITVATNETLWLTSEQHGSPLVAISGNRSDVLSSASP